VQFTNGEVHTPTVSKEAWRTYREGGWVGLGGNPEHGGMGMPKMLGVLFEEMLYAADSSFSLYSRSPPAVAWPSTPTPANSSRPLTCQRCTKAAGPAPCA
jgi:alkylation response protein AidB-like acyl-CoA dehydrogenase